jgi:hypothetical protein
VWNSCNYAFSRIWRGLTIVYKQTNPVAWIGERTIPTERPPLWAKLVPTFVVSTNGSLRPYSRISKPEPLLFLPSSSSLVLMRLSGTRSRPTTFQKIWQRRESKPEPLDL